MWDAKSRGRGLPAKTLAFGVSLTALGAAMTSPSFAQCIPDPTIASSATNCTGSDINGLRVTTPATTVSVGSGASVTNAGAAAIVIEVPNSQATINETISIAGSVSGGSHSGIQIMTGPVDAYNGSLTRLQLEVAAGGTLSGSTALSMANSPGSLYGTVLVGVNNSGTIAGTDGIALRGDLVMLNGFSQPSGAFSAITNRSGGVISGSIIGPVSALDNAGLIDGGSNSAISWTGSFPYTTALGTWANSGTIRSASAAATILGTDIMAFTNSGSIANMGSGPAIETRFLTLTNQAGGIISSAGPVAIKSTGLLNLTNAGTITGNIIAGPSNSMIDSRLGTINGSLIFGDGNDTLVVGYGGTSTPVTGITGSITAGGGDNTQLLKISADTTIATPFALLSGFQNFGIATDKGTTLTLEADFVAPTTITLTGQGTVVNRAAIVTAGPAFMLNDAQASNVVGLRNEGSIQTTTGGSTFAITSESAFRQVINNGIITAAGGGISAFQTAIVNNGTITAAGTGVVNSNSGLTNTGTIRSTAGIGVSLGGNVGTLSTNSGLIEGATSGASLSAYLTNSGTIVATQPGGVAIDLQPYGALINESGGVIGNGLKAITASVFNELVINAGTINGSVEFAGSSGERYISRPGGILNGDLILSGASVFMTDLVNTGPGPFAGINGTVSAASGAELRYRVSGASTAILGAVGPFSLVSYELESGASLTLNAPAPITGPLLLAGKGNVELNGAIIVPGTVANAAAIRTVQTLDDSFPGGFVGTQSELAIVNRGDITITRPLNGPFLSGAVLLGYTDNFTNSGTITVVDRNDFSQTTAISGGKIVTNSGTINLDGGLSISGSSAQDAVFSNSGTIRQVVGGAVARGVSVGRLFDNSGTVSVAGNAVLLNYGSLINSGLIESTAAIAVSNEFASGTIVNKSGGTISSGSGNAIQTYVSSFINEGAVIGNVDIGRQSTDFRALSSSTYVAAGGTIAGDLRFGNGQDLFLQTGAASGVSGIIDGGDGRDIYGFVRSASGSFELAAPTAINFEDLLVEVEGADTQITLTGASPFANTVYVLGAGTVINTATIDGQFSTVLTGPVIPGAETELKSLVNKGTIGGGVLADIATVINEGRLGATALTGQALSVTHQGEASLSNSGTILASPSNFGSPLATAFISGVDNVSVSNSGRIDGGLSSNVVFNNANEARLLSIANSGDIVATSTTPGATALSGTADSSGIGGAVSLINSGTISAGGSSNNTGVVLGDPRGLSDMSVTNSGLISAQATGGTGRAILLSGAGMTATMLNDRDGTISATGATAIAIQMINEALRLSNDGMIMANGTARNWAILANADNDDQIRNNGTITGNVSLSGGNDRIENDGTIAGSIMLGGGNDVLENRGVISGPVDLGDGDDIFRLASVRGFSGEADGGAGTDRFEIAVGSSDAAPITLGAGSFSNFETLEMQSGVASYGGNSSFGTITISGGRLIGLVGSRLAAGTITVASGATFGSAGAVVGNVAVAGTLSPGASPGTMTVQGNVSLAGSSTSLFEVTPTVSDTLIVSGTLTIAPGATLTMTGTRPLTPGVTYDLIAAAGGITGSFTTIDRAATIQGFLSQSATKLSLLGTFVTDPRFSPQVSATIGYLNNVLIAGQASPALIAAMPGLLKTDGTSNAAIFNQMSPEAYASASQLGTEQALTVIEAARSQIMARPNSDGLFTFGQALVNNRQMDGNASSGISDGRLHSYGGLAGIGVGSEQGWAGAFVGYLDGRQTIVGTGARTDVNHIIAGLQAAWQSGEFRFDMLAAYSGGDADTQRHVLGATLASHYRLHSLIGDIRASYARSLSDRWSLRPSVGLSGVRTTRGALAENGNSPFALAVTRDSRTRWFLDGELLAQGGQADHDAFHPYVAIGAQRRLKGRNSTATASFTGVAASYRLPGLERADMVATARIGMTYDLTERLGLFASYSGEFGDDRRHNGSVGLRLTM